jgi:hypothetical protein
MNGTTDDALPRPSDFPMGSPRSRAAARALLESKISASIRVRIIHIGRGGSDGLPPMQRIRSDDCVTEIVHVAGDEG